MLKFLLIAAVAILLIWLFVRPDQPQPTSTTSSTGGSFGLSGENVVIKAKEIPTPGKGETIFKASQITDAFKQAGVIDGNVFTNDFVTYPELKPVAKLAIEARWFQFRCRYQYPTKCIVFVNLFVFPNEEITYQAADLIAAYKANTKDTYKADPYTKTLSHHNYLLALSEDTPDKEIEVLAAVIPTNDK